MGPGFSPLDDELGLLPGALSPSLQEDLVHLGTWMPFGPAAAELARFRRVAVSEATATRQTEAAGAAWVELQTAEAERLEREAPEPPPGPAVQQLSVDGAMVPLVGGAWAEAKLLAIGTVEATPSAQGPPAVTTREWSYFARKTDAATFTRLALAELHRRGTERAGTVVAPLDGAEWEQTMLDHRCPNAVRILDFPHGFEHLATAAQATFGGGTAETSAWLEQQAHTLKHDDPEAVLDALRALPVGQASDPAAAEQARTATLGYFEKRRDQIRYAEFLARGYPIGSGGVESGNKLVTEARLKGAGMHWAPEHVDPMLALRTIACSDRWAEAWPQLARHLRRRARRRRSARGAPAEALPAADCPPAPDGPPAPTRQAHAPRPPRPKTIVDGRPTAEHPWKKYPFITSRCAKT